MMTRREATTAILAGTALAAAAAGVAQSPGAVPLPSPQITGGKPLMDALKARHSTREYSNRALPEQVLSDLLWAAFGVNRPSGDRTAPYWRHIMVIDIYLAMADGVWLYQPTTHSLLRLRGPRLGVSRSGRLSEARSSAEARGPAIRHVCANSGISAQLTPCSAPCDPPPPVCAPPPEGCCWASALNDSSIAAARIPPSVFMA